MLWFSKESKQQEAQTSTIEQMRELCDHEFVKIVGAGPELTEGPGAL